MNYSDVINQELHKILPKREKYTKRDIGAVIHHSLFNPYKGRTFTEREAVFIVKATAAYYDTDWSDTISHWNTPKAIAKRMFCAG